MYVVVVSPRELPEQVSVYGPYRTMAKADHIAECLTNPFYADFVDSDEYDVYTLPLQRPE